MYSKAHIHTFVDIIKLMSVLQVIAQINSNSKADSLQSLEVSLRVVNVLNTQVALNLFRRALEVCKVSYELKAFPTQRFEVRSFPFSFLLNEDAELINSLGILLKVRKASHHMQCTICCSLLRGRFYRHRIFH